MRVLGPSGIITGAHAGRPPASMTERASAGIMRRRIWSGNVTEPFETITVDTDRVACDGGGGALGHPKVYLNLGEERRVECPYCSRLYVLAEGAKSGAHAH